MADSIVETWCVTCQRGLAGYKPVVSPGDQCPICIQNVKTGRIGEDKIGKVWDLKEYRAFVEKRNEVKRMELEAKKGRQVGAKGVDVHRKEIEAEFSAKFAAQQEEIESLKKLVVSVTKKKQPVASVDTEDRIKNITNK